MARISDAIGYDVEVSEPNGPTVHGYITDRWANSRQPLPVKPSREAVARALAEHRLMGGRCRCGLDPRLDYYRYEQHVTDAVLDLLPGRSEAEVKAEALREASDWLAHEYGNDGFPGPELRARADRLAAEGGADRG